MGEVKALVITGYGLNCEAETSFALARAGAAVEQMHLNDLLDRRRSLAEFQLLVLIGGFSFGDHVSAGKVFANRLKYRLREELDGFVAEGKLILGICNGFQTLVKLGMLPGFDGDYRTQRVSLAANDSGVFRDAWVRLRAEPASPCVFTRGLELFDLPVRHGEGKFCAADERVLDRLEAEAQVALRYARPETGEPTEEYPHNPNGSARAVAGICDPTGRIFGLMPHPEGYLSPCNHPLWTRWKAEGRLPQEGAGLALFNNAVNYLKGKA